MKIKSTHIIALALVMSSCGTYTGEGAYAGATFGSILGSAIGGVSGGYRGSDIGTIVGMAGGAVIGTAIGAASDNAAREESRQRSYNDYQNRRYSNGNSNSNINTNFNRNSNSNSSSHSNNYTNPNGYSQSNNYSHSNNYTNPNGYSQSNNYSQSNRDYNESGFDPNNGGDDRLDFQGNDNSSVRSKTYVPTESGFRFGNEDIHNDYSIKYNSLIEIRKATFADRDNDGVLLAGEESKISFEIINNSSKVLYDIQPTVVETTGNKHIHISPNVHVESIEPGKGVRYTAIIFADRRLKNGSINIQIGVAQGNKVLTSQIKEFTLQTQRK